ncbi:divalent-cation tolerance protein CutA [Myxococcota bacterium]|nr:divalent-cation tolerance protein CutA [Myxococcota bacterium]
MTEPLRIVLITAPDDEVSSRIARILVEERLAACVNIVPGIRSVYRWQGAVEEDSEFLLIAKTRSDRFEALARRAQELHPYELPEILMLPVEGGSDDYMDWVRSEATL